MRRLALLGAVATLAGCGGGEEKPTKEEFARSADAICAELDRQSEELAGADADSPEEFVSFARRARDAAREAVRRVGELEVPEGADGEVAQAWQDAVRTQAEEEVIPAFDKLEKAAQANDEQALVAAAQELQDVDSSRADRLATDLGARRCAE